MTNIGRKLLIALLATLALAPQPVSAQDDSDAAAIEAALADAGLTVDEVLAEDVNSSWDGLGMFSEDMTRLLGALSADAEPETYAFADSKANPPIITPSGGLPTAAGAAVLTVPSDWAAPESGVNSSVAFTHAPGPQVAPGDEILFLWTEFDSDYDFSDPSLTINEGFPLTVPGLPVWNSTFAGDTWEGANLIPNATYDGSTLSFDVKSFQPPQAFPLVDLPGFYYRSGNVVGVALGADALREYINAAATTGTASAPATPSQTLLYTGGADDTNAQFADPLVQLSIRFFVHLAQGGFFLPGFIALMFLLAMNLSFAGINIGLLIVAVLLSTTTTAQAAEPEPGETATPAAPTSEPASTPTAPASIPAPTGGGLGFWWVIIVGLGALMILVGVIVRLRNRDPEEVYILPPEGPPGYPEPEDPDDDDDDPRDTPPPTIFGEEIDGSSVCGWEVKFNDGGNWIDIKALEPGESPCCVYKIEVETRTLFHDAVASFRQDVEPERLYIPALESRTTGLNWHSASGTRSGPLGRQDWQHGGGNPIDQSQVETPSAYWQEGQGDERPEVTAQMAHIEVSRVTAWLESGCPGHENTFNTSSHAEVQVMATHECTNDNPGPACPVELNAYGGFLGMAFGDQQLAFGDAIGTDYDEIERWARDYADLTPEQREKAPPPPLSAIGTWDGHDHDVRDRMTYESSNGDAEHPLKDGDFWEAFIITMSVHLAGQLVPVAVWPTTERVSTWIEAGFDWNINLSAEMKKEPCDEAGHCTGHPGRQCHGQPEFKLTLSAADNSIRAGGKTKTIERPSPPSFDGLTIPRINHLWEVDSRPPIGFP